MGNLNNGYIGFNNINEELDIQGTVNSRRDYLDKLYRTYKYDPEWVRPSDWLTITDPAPGEQKFVGLLGISDAGDEANRVNIRFAAAYNVDWGDGTFSSHSSGTVATHDYNYASIPAGTTTSYGLRQVIVTVTPQTGQNLTVVDLLETPGTYFQQSIFWLDVVIRVPNCTSLAVAGSTQNFPLLERFRVLEIGNATNATNLFYRCFKLRVVEFPPTWKPTVLSGMFSYCNDLLYAPYINTELCTSAPSMFSFCSSLKYTPEYSFPIALTLSSLFSYCYSLEYVGDFYAPAATAISGLFLNCYALREVGNLTFGNTTGLRQLFDTCYSLKKIKSITYSGTVTDMYRTFYQCSSLLNLPPVNGTTINTSALSGSQGSSYTFYACRSLRSLPQLNYSSASVMTYNFAYCESVPEIDIITSSSLVTATAMCYNCSSLKKFSITNTSSVTNFNAMFYECRALISLPAMNQAGVTSSTGIDSNTTSGRMLYNTYGLTSFLGTGARVTISFQYCKLGRNEIVTVFNNLGTASGTQTVNVRNNPGTPGVTAGDIAIATGKGWTVLT